MKQFLSLLLIVLVIGSCNPLKIDSPKTHDDKLLNSLNGLWIQEADSISELSINGNSWKFDQGESYNATVTNSIEEFKSKSGFIILVKQKDTLCWEFINMKKNKLNFLRFPSGKKISYYRKK